MTTNTLTNLEKIRQACIKANPNILDKCKWCGSSDLTWYDECPDYGFCNKCGKAHNKSNVGREIRLADVLLAMKSVEKREFEAQVDLIRGSVEDCMWNLKKDNLELQSPETLQFLADLL